MKWPAPDGADVRVAVLGRERLEDRLQPLQRRLVAAGHQAEADLEPPDAARDADVDERDLLLPRLLVAALRVAEVRVAAVDDRVAGLEDAEQLLERVLGDLPGRDHHPDVPRRVELLRERAERLRGRRRRSGRTSSPRARPAAAASSSPSPSGRGRPCRVASRCPPVGSGLRACPAPRAPRGRRPPASGSGGRSRSRGPGIASSSPVSSTTWTKRPVFGPPLCSWPVECR